MNEWMERMAGEKNWLAVDAELNSKKNEQTSKAKGTEILMIKLQWVANVQLQIDWWMRIFRLIFGLPFDNFHHIN